MTDRAKFEQMLEYLINEDKAKAEELFHELVVGKSREIYESLLDDDVDLDEADDKEEDEEDKDDKEVDENFELGIDEVGGDPADDMMSDLEAGDDEGGEMDMGGDEMGGDEPATKDDVMDIKDALMDLKAEFEAMLSGDGEEAGDEEGDEEAGDEEGDEEAGDEEGDEEGENPFAKEDLVREYVEKVPAAKMGDDGANTKSIVAKPNNMGGTTANLRGGESTKAGTQGGLANPSTKDMSTGNVNVPGGKAGVKHLKGVSAPKGGDDGQNKKSTLGA